MSNLHEDKCTCNECAPNVHHEHDHHHDNKCTCAECCTHTHNHKSAISVDNHEGAIIGTLSLHSELCYDELKDKCLSAINELKKWALSNKYLIGHIKGYTEKNGMVCTFSTTGHDVTITELPSEPAKNNFNIICILFGASKTDIETQLQKYLL